MRRLLLATLLVLCLAAPAAALDGRFGFFGAELSLEGDYLQDVGAGIVHAMLPYKGVYDGATGTWHFQRYDDLCSQLTQRGSKLMLTILPPNNINKVRSKNFSLFLKRAVERYDGDADCGCTEAAPDCYAPGDGLWPPWAPGAQPVAKFWQAGNEVDVDPYWRKHPAYYEEFLNLVYLKTKAACPECQVILGSSMRRGLDPEESVFLQNLSNDAVPFDIIDIHLFGQMNRDHFERFARDMRTVADNIYHGKPIWMSETATYSDQPLKANGKPYPAQSELLQATELLKRYVYFASAGVDKVFWDYLYETTFGSVPDGYWWYTGLVYDGQGSQDKGDHVKKLGYFTYKQMVRKLSPTSGHPVESRPAANVYLYRYLLPAGSGRPLFVAWWDWFNEAGTTKDVRLYVGPLGEVKVTEAIPAVLTGQEVGDFETAFTTYTATVDADGYINITLGKRPVYIE